MFHVEHIKKIMKYLVNILFSIILLAQSHSQVVGRWKAYFNTNTLNYICNNGVYVYAANNSNIIQYNTSNFEINTFNKVNSLNDVDISGVFSVGDFVIVGYNNGNIDIIENHLQITNVPDIKINNNILGSKRINDVQMINNTIYVGTDFGIVTIDPNTFFIIDSYFFEANSNIFPCRKIAFSNDTLYALSEVLLHIQINDNLKQFNNWDTLYAENNEIKFFELINNSPYIVSNNNFDSLWIYQNNNWNYLDNQQKNVKFLNGELININDSLYTLDGSINFLLDSYDGFYKVHTTNYTQIANDYYFTDEYIGLIKYNNSGYQSLTPSGPNSNQAYYLNYHTNSKKIFASSSNSIFNSWNTRGVSFYDNENWTNIVLYDPARNKYPFDIIDIEANDDLSIQLFASNFDGLVVLKNNQYQFFHPGNSTFTTNPNWTESCAITGLTYNNNYFVVCNSNTAPYTVYFMDENLNFYPIKHNSTLLNTLILKPILTDDHILLLPTKNGLVLVDTKGTYSNPNDDLIKVINESNSELPSNAVNTISIDQNNNIIIGTNAGFAILSNWESFIKGNGNFNLYQPLIEQDGFIEIVLGETPINNICVDPGNRKWLATKTSGLYLLDPTMKYEIHYFNPENSPLLDYNINDVTVNESTGEVFISSANGIVSYQGNATASSPEKNDVIIYPSPVPPNYTGNILIKQTPENANIRIVDQNGNLVRILDTFGGGIEWNLKNTAGEKVSTGIYYFIISSETDQVHYTSKILIK